jgi:ammonium transporter, Amt family
LGAATGALAWVFIECGIREVQCARDRDRHGRGSRHDYTRVGFVGPVGAIVIDTCAGWVCFFATQVLKRVLKIDDSLDVSHVRGVCVYSELCSPRSSWTQASVALATLLA